MAVTDAFSALKEVRVAVERFSIGGFFMKRGWALKDGAGNHAVITTRQLERLCKEGKVKLMFEEKAWQELYLHHRGQKTSEEKRLADLKAKEAAAKAERERLAKDAERKKKELEELQRQAKARAEREEKLRQLQKRYGKE